MRVSVQGSGLTDRRTPPASPTEGRKPVHGRPQSLFHRYGGKGRPGSAGADLSPEEGRKEEKERQKGWLDLFLLVQRSEGAGAVAAAFLVAEAALPEDAVHKVPFRS